MNLMRSTVFFSALLIVFFWGCSSTSSTPDHYRAPLFEDKISLMKNTYLEQCLAPLSRREYSDKGCAFKLLTSLERSYGISFNQKQLLSKANELFLGEVEKQLVLALQHKGATLNELRRTFKGKEDALAYLRQNYSFSVDDLSSSSVD